jgi:hypothetical protein
MTTPGFSAEASLYDRSKRYWMMAQGSSRGDVVEPAGPIACAACLAATCWWAGPLCWGMCVPICFSPSP